MAKRTIHTGEYRLNRRRSDGMQIQLFRRHCGVHTPVREAIEIPCAYKDIYKGEDKINEQLLIDNILSDYLLTKVGHVF